MTGVELWLVTEIPLLHHPATAVLRAAVPASPPVQWVLQLQSALQPPSWPGQWDSVTITWLSALSSRGFEKGFIIEDIKLSPPPPLLRLSVPPVHCF